MNLPRTSMTLVTLIVILWIGILALPYQTKAQTDFGAVYNIKWSPTGEKIALAGSKGVWIYDINSGNLVQLIQSLRMDIDWSSDGSKFATLEIEFTTGTIEIWNSQSLMLIRTIEDNRLTEDRHAIDWNPSNDSLAVSGQGVRIWDTSNGNLQYTLEQNQNTTTHLSWNDAGTRLAVANVDNITRVIDVSGNVFNHFDSRESNLGVAWNSVGDTLAVSEDNNIRIWQLATNTPIATLAGHNSHIRHIVWQGNVLVSSSGDGQINFWDGNTYQLIETIPPENASSAIALSPDNTQLAYIDEIGTLQIIPVPNATACDATQTIPSSMAH